LDQDADADDTPLRRREAGFGYLVISWPGDLQIGQRVVEGAPDLTQFPG
jgi:hypothetical protein